MIVDDSLSVRKSLTQLVEDAGYQASTAIDGMDALDAIERVNPSVMIVDLEMPRMNGIELVQKLRNMNTYKNLPIFMVTSRSMREHRAMAEKAGVSCYVTKPFSDEDLLGMIHQSLHGDELPSKNT